MLHKFPKKEIYQIFFFLHFTPLTPLIIEQHGVALNVYKRR